MARRDTVQKTPQRPAENEVTPREKEVLSPFTVVSVSPALSECIHVGKQVCVYVYVCVHNPTMLLYAVPVCALRYCNRQSIIYGVGFYIALHKRKKKSNNDYYHHD